MEVCESGRRRSPLADLQHYQPSDQESRQEHENGADPLQCMPEGPASCDRGPARLPLLIAIAGPAAELIVESTGVFHLRCYFGCRRKAQLMDSKPGLRVGIQSIESCRPVILQGAQVVQQRQTAMLVGELGDAQDILRLFQIVTVVAIRERLRGDIACPGLIDRFSTYRTSRGPRLAALVVDASDELRDREEESLHQLLTGSRILVSAVSHEIRNICGAIALVHENLSRSGALSENRDFEALGSLVIALERIAAMELRQTGDQATAVHLQSFFNELRIVNGPSFREKEIAVEWNIPADLPAVWADPHSLMQVFLNLIKNSERALIARRDCRVRISAAVAQQRVLIHVSDNGVGIENPELLFRPFQQNAKSSGLGLYLSRALLRSFGGDLRCEPATSGALFVIELAAIVRSDYASHGSKDQTVAH
jgi:signal transduction histidine kinase